MSHKILVVDDDAAVRGLVAHTLRDEGYEVQTAANGAEALEAIDGRCPDAIVLDLEMPVMDGRAFYERLRLDTPCVSPVIILSALDALWAGRELDAEAAIEKPFDPDELIETVGRLAGGVS